MAISIEQALRRKLKGIPQLNSPSHETLRGKHQGATILVHGNGPSCKQGYQYCKEKFGDNFISIGMNASINVIKPDYYILVDRRATLRYLSSFTLGQCPLLISQQALRLIDNKLKDNEPKLYNLAVDAAKHPMTLQIERAQTSTVLKPTLSQFPGDAANAGIIGTCLALLMLLPTLDSNNHWSNEIQPGHLLITGIDGYPINQTQEHHINPDSPPPSDALESNLYTSGYLMQLMTLAYSLGIQITNTNKPGTLPVNSLFRAKETS